MTEDHANVPLTVGTETLPRYLFPESAARVMSKVARYAEWRSSPPAVYPDFEDVQATQAREICLQAMAHRGEGWLQADEVRSVLEAFKLPGPTGQPAPAGGLAIRVAVTEDPLFGPLLSFGLGGLYQEIFHDVSFRITPLSAGDAHAMVRALKAYRLLQGYQGHAPADVDALEELLLRTASLVEEIPEICELEMSPVFARSPGQGAFIANARVRVSTPSRNQPARYAV